MSKTFKYILDFEGKTDQFKRDIGGINGMLKTAVTAAAGLFATGQVIEFGKASIEAFNNSIQSETALLTALKGRSDIQGNLIDQASELMGKTLFDDDEIVRAQSLVAAFVKEEDKIKSLIPLIQDFATAKQMDLAGAADLVTKTLAGEMNALGRYGIKVEGAAGSTERLTMIQKGLNDAFGGQAEAAAKVGTASLVMLENQFGNLKESIGELIIAQQNEAGSFVSMLTEMTVGTTAYLNDIKTLKEGDALSPGNSDPAAWWAFINPWGTEEDWAEAVDGIKAKAAMLKNLKFAMSNEGESFASDNSVAKESETISTLTEKIKLLEAQLDNIPLVNKKAIDAQKQKIASTKAELNAITAVSEASKYQAGTVGALGEKLTQLNEQISNTNAGDTEAIRLLSAKAFAINAQISAIDKLKAATALMAEDTANGFRGEAFMQITPITKAQVTGSDKAFDTKAKLDITDMQKNMPVYIAAQEEMRAQMDATAEMAQVVGSAVGDGFTQIGQSAIDGLGLAQSGWEGFAGVMLQTTTKIIGMLLANAVANAIVSGSESAAAMGPAAVFALPAFIATAVAGVMGAFAAIAFADGGIVSGPTHALVGEYPGARSNPEVIAPLSKLKAMIGGGSGDPIILQPSLELGYDSLRIRLNRVTNNTRKRTGR